MAGGWVEFADPALQALNRKRGRQFTVLMVIAMPVAGFIPKSGPALVEIVPWWIVVPGGMLVGLLAGLLLRLGFYVAYRPFAVDPAAGRIRIRGRVYDYSELTHAGVAILGDQAEVAVQRRAGHGPRATVLVRDASGPTLDDKRRDLLLDVVRGSSITRPTSRYDPEGRFGRYNHPMTLDRDDALSVIASPPAPGDPTPWGM